jgi:DNA-binding LacI/PurR family transcriptional regulator
VTHVTPESAIDGPAAARRATIRDVASHAGVSHQTVSRVINGNPNVSGPTREKVLATINALGYVPSPMARGLISNRTHSIGIVAEDISDQTFARWVAGAERAARARGYYLMIGSVEPEDDERGYLRLMIERRVEGLLLARPSVLHAGSELEPVVAAGVPIVSVGSSRPQGIVVDVDNRQGGYDATRHLVAHGHREIATILGPADWPSTAARLDGYRGALDEAGIAYDPALVVQAADWGLESGRAAAAELHAHAARFTALFAHSDLIAFGAMRELRLHGITIPGDISVVGYDDLPVAAYVDPPLTTVHQPMEELGALAASLLLDQLAGHGPQEAQTRLLPAELVSRESVARVGAA